MFVSPAFKNILNTKYILRISVTSTLLAIAGSAFAYICILPGTLEFFKGFDGSGLSALISADSYLSFLTNLIIMFVIVFQIPLVISIIDRIKPIPPKKLLKYEGPVIFVCIFASLLAPFTYDLFTNLIFAGPMILLYNFSIIIIAVSHLKKPKEKPLTRSQLSSPNMLETFLENPVLSTSTIVIQKPISNHRVMDIRTSRLRPAAQENIVHQAAAQKPIVKPVYTKPKRLFFDVIPATKISHV